MAKLNWLTARPIAHRGLHDLSAGAVENTAAAFSAAIASGYGIETDLQISADSEAMVHHDDALGRLTEGSGLLAEMSAAQIKAVRFKGSTGRILTLEELCDLVAGRVALLLELKSRFDGDTRLARRAIDVLASYKGPVALMSFDPALIEFVRHDASDLPRGIVAERYYSHPEWDGSAELAKAKPVLAAARPAQPSAIPGLFGQGSSSDATIGGTHDGSAIVDVDCAQRGRS